MGRCRFVIDEAAVSWHARHEDDDADLPDDLGEWTLKVICADCLCIVADDACVPQMLKRELRRRDLRLASNKAALIERLQRAIDEVSEMRDPVCVLLYRLSRAEVIQRRL